MYYVYAESVLMINFCINLILIYVLAKINKRKFLILRSIIAAMIGAIYALLFIMNLRIFTYPIFKIIFAFLMVLISTNKAHFKTIILLSFQYFFLAFICAGAVLFISNFIDEEITNLAGIIVISNMSTNKIITVISMIAVITIIVSEIVKKKDLCSTADLILTYGDKTCTLSAFADNGNLLRSLSGKNVILVERSSIRHMLEECLGSTVEQAEDIMNMGENKSRITIVNANSVTGNKNILCFKPDAIKIACDNCIHDVSSDALIGILDTPLKGLDKDLKAIFNPILLTKGNKCVHD